MFTGIIETSGIITQLRQEQQNLQITVASKIANQLHIDQSVAHNGVCLTVLAQTQTTHTVTAIDQTLQKTNLGQLTIGSKINLERCLPANGRLDGHFVQGHVNTTAQIVNIADQNGSWLFTFLYPPDFKNLLVPKGSVAIDGVSLTVIEPTDSHFSVAIIPYTYQHTNFNLYKTGDTVNIEFDILGKYIARMLNKDI